MVIGKGGPGGGRGMWYQSLRSGSEQTADDRLPQTAGQPVIHSLLGHFLLEHKDQQDHGTRNQLVINESSTACFYSSVFTPVLIIH